MKLIEQGKLHMEDKVFGPDGVLGTSFGNFPYKKNITEITIDELLHHTCGGWSNDDSKYPDPMFSNPGLHVDELIGWTLDHIPLDNPPGTHYAYSNFGYCVLGRVIEKVTGFPYEQAAKKLILHPCGITDMQIGGNGLQHRRPDEVKYYGQNGEDPYNMNISRLDAHGGWIATATDLAKFMCHINDSTNDILQPSTIELMNTGSSANPKYACGWTITGPNTWHTGSLPGTQTEQAIIKQKGNYTFAILTNTRTNDSGFQHDMDRIFWNALGKNPVWPNVDLFNNGN
jgi:D-alanyl-D-alanine carboxypeptidase